MYLCLFFKLVFTLYFLCSFSGSDRGYCRVCLQDFTIPCHPVLRKPCGLVSWQYVSSWKLPFLTFLMSTKHLSAVTYWAEGKILIGGSIFNSSRGISGEEHTYSAYWHLAKKSWLSVCACVFVCNSQTKAAGEDGRVLPVNIWRGITDGTTGEISCEYKGSLNTLYMCTGSLRHSHF